MPSWNIHTAHVERLANRESLADLGIADANAFLFGNHAPDVYVGFMVPDADFRVDYCITHEAKPNLVPVPNADIFWDRYIVRRTPKTDAGMSLAIGAWAHLMTDRYYNGNFRTFWLTHDVPTGEILRKGKQGDFDLFGRSLHITTHVQPNDELLKAARAFAPYSILPKDVKRAARVANDIVDNGGRPLERHEYVLLDEQWMNDVFDACDERISTWLRAWRELVESGRPFHADDVRAQAGLPQATPDEPNWQRFKPTTEATGS